MVLSRSEPDIYGEITHAIKQSPLAQIEHVVYHAFTYITIEMQKQPAYMAKSARWNYLPVIRNGRPTDQYRRVADSERSAERIRRWTRENLQVAPWSDYKTRALPKNLRKYATQIDQYCYSPLGWVTPVPHRLWDLPERMRELADMMESTQKKSRPVVLRRYDGNHYLWCLMKEVREYTQKPRYKEIIYLLDPACKKAGIPTPTISQLEKLWRDRTA